MSLELRQRIYTADDLFEFLKTVPPALRSQMGIDMVITDINDKEMYADGSNVIYVEAYDVTETEGCRETGLRFSCDQNDTEENN